MFIAFFILIIIFHKINRSISINRYRFNIITITITFTIFIFITSSWIWILTFSWWWISFNEINNINFNRIYTKYTINYHRNNFNHETKNNHITSTIFNNITFFKIIFKAFQMFKNKYISLIKIITHYSIFIMVIIINIYFIY